MKIRHKIIDIGDVKELDQTDGMLAEFEGTISTGREDRDGDILDPQGAEVDPAMPLLWQHDPGQPIGKLVGVTQHDGERLAGRFVVADTPLGRDAVQLLRLGVLRLSHGFQPKKYEPRKCTGGGDGYHIQEYEVLETSLVSVPSNPDATITALSELKFATPCVKGLVQGLLEERKDAMKSDELTNEGGVASEDMTATIARLTERLDSLEATKAPSKTTPKARDVFAGVKVHAPSERYDTAWLPAKHAKTGQMIFDEHGRTAKLPPEKVYAQCGAFLKFLGHRAGLDCPLSEHERDLLEESYRGDWCGKFGGVFHDRLDGLQCKAVLDDATSGGAEVVPIFFDQAVIQFPLLNGEITPFVDIKPVPRGRNVEGASVDNPTVTWGTADGTTQAAFNTASLIADLNTTIFPVSVNLEAGRDFLADSAVDVGRILIENIGQRFANELDNVIINGNGTSQPEGIFVATGVTDVGNPAGGAAAVPQVADYEELLFAVAKQYRQRGLNPTYIANDTTYSRARGIAVGAADERRVFGMTHNDYQLLGWPFRIENNLANPRAAFGCLKKYRLYRRMGQSVQWTSEGKTLAQANLTLLVVRGRYGGRVMDANAFVKQTNGQT